MTIHSVYVLNLKSKEILYRKYCFVSKLDSSLSNVAIFEKTMLAQCANKFYQLGDVIGAVAAFGDLLIVVNGSDEIDEATCSWVSYRFQLRFSSFCRLRCHSCNQRSHKRCA